MHTGGAQEPVSEGSRSPHRPGDVRLLPLLLMYASGQGVVRVGVVHAGRRDLVELLAVAGDGVGEGDDVEDLGAADAGNRTARML